jgi:hypothetical protein
MDGRCHGHLTKNKTVSILVTKSLILDTDDDKEYGPEVSCG